MKESCDKSCRECREWGEHFYWNHLDKQKMHFFKFMVGDFAQCMSMPKKFVNHFNGQICEHIDLKPPSGDIWRIGLTKVANEIVLQSGWKDFVDAHRIEENDLLIFKYYESSSFEVLIFDGSGCEKASSFFAKKNDPPVGEADEIPLEVINRKELIELRSSGSSSEDDAKPEITTKSLNGSKKMSKRILRAGSGSGEKDAGTYVETLVHRKKYRVSPRKYAGPSKGVNYGVKKDTPERDEHGQMPCNAPYFSLRSLQLSPSQHKKLTVFLFYLQKNIPRSFAAAHLPRRCEQIILKRPNQKKKWITSYVSTRQVRGVYGGIYGGWKHFVIDNNLQQGDICLFELMKNKKMLTMTV
ncbi:B3 domain-containing protein, partial [Ananas comosus]